MSIGFLILVVVVFLAVGAILSTLPSDSTFKRMAFIALAFIAALFVLYFIGEVSGLYHIPLHIGK